MTPRFRGGSALTVVALDTSSFMRDLDPERHVPRALRLLAALQRPGDQLAIVAFAETARVLLPPTDAGPELEARVGEVLASTTSEGRITRASVGLNLVARVLLDGRADLAERRVLLISGGGEDPIAGDAAEAARSRARTMDLVPQMLRGSGAVLDTIALTRAADRALLSTLALRTGGAHRAPIAPEGVAAAIAALTSAGGARAELSVAGAARTFTVDARVGALRVLLDRAAGPVTLISPSDEPVGLTWSGSGPVAWALVEHPLPGTWRVVQPADAEPPRVWLERGGPALGVAVDALTPTVDERPRLGAFVGPLDPAPQLLRGLAVVTDEDDRRWQVQLERRGPRALEVPLAPRRAGRHRIDVTVDVDGHARAAHLELDVRPSCLAADVDVEHGALSVRARSACAEATVRALALVERTSGLRRALEVVAGEGDPRRDPPGEGHAPAPGGGHAPAPAAGEGPAPAPVPGGDADHAAASAHDHASASAHDHASASAHGAVAAHGPQAAPATHAVTLEAADERDTEWTLEGELSIGGTPVVVRRGPFVLPRAEHHGSGVREVLWRLALLNVPVVLALLVRALRARRAREEPI